MTNGLLSAITTDKDGNSFIIFENNTPVISNFFLIKDVLSVWEKVNPFVPGGVCCIATDPLTNTTTMRIGNGIDKWGDLPNVGYNGDDLITITLSREVAHWLKHLVAKPSASLLYIAHEDPVDVLNRKIIYDALETVTIDEEFS